jgi:hypothetical protein
MTTPRAGLWTSNAVADDDETQRPPMKFCSVSMQ